MTKPNRYFIPLIFFFSLSSMNCGTTKTNTVIKDDRLDIQRDKIVNYAKNFIGTKYKYAGDSPDEGFDCSGFTKYVFSNFGFDVPRRSADYSNIGKKTEVNDCIKADILLFTGRDNSSKEIGHVAIVISNENGDIQFIHASTTRGVVISDMKVSYYKERILGAVRIIY
jgi:murein DD-endopeptidase / murein LD-carboxypeptidase